MAQYVGTVAWFSTLKGYGFLASSGIPDTFCHYSAIQHDGYKTLNQHDAVEFDVEVGRLGRQAANVRSLAQKVPPDVGIV